MFDYCIEYHKRRLLLAEELLLPKVENGEIWAIQNLCKIIAEALDDECQLTPSICAFLSASLYAIYDGKTGDEAFFIKRNRGESDRRKARKKAFMIADYTERIRRLDGITVETARDIASKRFHVSEDSIRKYRKQHLKEVKRLLDLEMDNFGKIRRL